MCRTMSKKEKKQSNAKRRRRISFLRCYHHQKRAEQKKGLAVHSSTRAVKTLIFQTFFLFFFRCKF